MDRVARLSTTRNAWKNPPNRIADGRGLDRSNFGVLVFSKVAPMGPLQTCPQDGNCHTAGPVPFEIVIMVSRCCIHLQDLATCFLKSLADIGRDNVYARQFCADQLRRPAAGIDDASR